MNVYSSQKAPYKAKILVHKEVYFLVLFKQSLDFKFFFYDQQIACAKQRCLLTSTSNK